MGPKMPYLSVFKKKLKKIFSYLKSEPLNKSNMYFEGIQ